MEKPTAWKILVLGDIGVGKTTLVQSFVYGYTSPQHIENNYDIYQKRTSSLGKTLIIDFLDFPCKAMQYSSMTGFVIVYSVNNRDSFEMVNSTLQRLQCVKGNIPVVILGNKCDEEVRRKVTTDEAVNLAERWNVPFLETSAKFRINIEEAFNALIAEIYQKMKMSKDKPCTIS